jgi:hypothetical protein
MLDPIMLEPSIIALVIASAVLIALAIVVFDIGVKRGSPVMTGRRYF